MSIVENLAQALGRGSEIVHARVTGIDGDERLLVRPAGEASEDWHCDVLETGPRALAFELGDRVLVLRPAGPGSDGIVLGRVGRATVIQGAGATTPAADARGSQRERRIVIEADEELILRVGESSIRIASDGKVVIRGQHVLTRAKGTNRIKGGSVAIN